MLSQNSSRRKMISPSICFLITEKEQRHTRKKLIARLRETVEVMYTQNLYQAGMATVLHYH